MQNGQLEKHMDFLLAIALKKCGCIEDAQDLTQDTLMAALKYLLVGNTIDDYKAFLMNVLNRRFNDFLRRKYKRPTMYIGTIPDILDDDSAYDAVVSSEEAERLRGQLAFLSKQYREVLVRHYVYGESVKRISISLGIPQGTVKSRLYNGREHLKKGLDGMERYATQSFAPERLWMSCSGKMGINNEPFTLVRGMIEQNLLILAYEKPLTIDELSKTIGIATAYIEPIVESLVGGELLRRVGNKVYTDFVIYTVDEKLDNLPKQIHFAEENFNVLWQPVKDGLARIQEQNWYVRLSREQKAKCEYYFVMHTLDSALFLTGGRCYDNTQKFPQRPNGGEWLAFGHATPRDFSWDDIGYHKYIYSGGRSAFFENKQGIKSFGIMTYSTPLEEEDYLRGPVPTMDDSDLAQLLFNLDNIIKYSSEPWFDLVKQHNNGSYLRNIPHLKTCGILKNTNGKTVVDIPVLSKFEYDCMKDISNKAVENIVTELVPPLKKHLEGSKKKIPAHLKSVPEQKLYLEAMYCIAMALVREAMKRDGYRSDVDFPCPPMVMVVEP